MDIGLLIYHSALAVLTAWITPLFVMSDFLENAYAHSVCLQVSITLIATGFKRQDEPEGRTSKVILLFDLKFCEEFLTQSHVFLQLKGWPADPRREWPTSIFCRRQHGGDPGISSTKRPFPLPTSLIVQASPFSRPV